MDNKNFKGFYIIGACNKYDAERGKGLTLWLQKKPSKFSRFMNRLLLNIFWVDKEDYEKHKPVITVETEEATFKVEMPKRSAFKEKKHESQPTTKNSGRSSRKSKEQD